MQGLDYSVSRAGKCTSIAKVFLLHARLKSTHLPILYFKNENPAWGRRKQERQ